MSSRDGDPFNLVFAAFTASLKDCRDDASAGAGAAAPLTHAHAHAKGGAAARVAALGDKVSAFMRADLQRSATQRLQRVQHLRGLALARLATSVQQQSKKLDAVASSHFHALASAVRHRNATERRLMQQVLGSDRRMRELIFEILGEYGKSDVRVKRRQEYVVFTARMKLVTRISLLRWQRFALFLCSELSASAHAAGPPHSLHRSNPGHGHGDAPTDGEASAATAVVVGTVLSPDADSAE